MLELTSLARRFDSTVWLGVGVLGLLVFLVGAYTPALSGLPGSVYLSYGFAFLGGAIALLGFSCYLEQRTYEKLHPRRRRPLEGRSRQMAIAPSFEVYDPRNDPSRRPPPGSGDGDAHP